MARGTKLKPTIVIKDVQPDKRVEGFVDRTIVSLEVDNGEQVWHQAVSILTPERPLSVEEFIIHLRDDDNVELKPPEEPQDPLKYLKEAQESGDTHEVDLSGAVAKVKSGRLPEEE